MIDKVIIEYGNGDTFEIIAEGNTLAEKMRYVVHKIKQNSFGRDIYVDAVTATVLVASGYLDTTYNETEIGRLKNGAKVYLK